VNAPVQIDEISLKVHIVLFPRHPIDPWGRVPFQPKERKPQSIDGDVVR
jgi:hypothetical protein